MSKRNSNSGRLKVGDIVRLSGTAALPLSMIRELGGTDMRSLRGKPFIVFHVKHGTAMQSAAEYIYSIYPGTVLPSDVAAERLMRAYYSRSELVWDEFLMEVMKANASRGA